MLGRDHRFEAKTGHNAGELLPLIRRTRRRIAGDHGDVAQIGPGSQKARELAQRGQHGSLHLPRPADCRAVFRHRRNLLVPEVQPRNPLAGAHTRSVTQRN